MTTGTELLQKVVIFKDFDGDELNRVTDVCREENFAPGAHVFREGKHGNRLYLIIEGEVRISRDVSGSHQPPRIRRTIRRFAWMNHTRT